MNLSRFIPVLSGERKDMKKRKDECQLCSSRSCYHRIYRTEEPKYDEVYCDKHIKDAEALSDKILGINNKIYRTFENSTGKLWRGNNYGYTIDSSRF